MDGWRIPKVSRCIPTDSNVEQMICCSRDPKLNRNNLIRGPRCGFAVSSHSIGLILIKPFFPPWHMLKEELRKKKALSKAGKYPL